MHVFLNEFFSSAPKVSLASQMYFSPCAHARLISGWRREEKIRLVTIDRISFLAAEICADESERSNHVITIQVA